MFLTVRETAERLKISPSCVYQLVERGKLPCHRIGVGRGAIRISEADLAEYLQTCRFEKSEPAKTPAHQKLKHLKL